jgi:hypothetical protein
MIRPLRVRFGRGDANAFPKNLRNIDSDRADSFRVGGASPPRNAIKLHFTREHSSHGK